MGTVGMALINSFVEKIGKKYSTAVRPVNLRLHLYGATKG